MYDFSKDPADNERVVSGLYAGQAGISPRKKPTWGGSKALPTKNRKLLGFFPLFLMKHAILFSFLELFYFISVFPSGEGGGTLHPRSLLPCSWAY